MQKTRLLIALVATLATAACARQQPRYYTLDPNTGQPVAVAAQQSLAQPRFASQAMGQPTYRPSPTQSDRDLYSSSPASAQQAYDQPPYAQHAYTQQASVQPESGGRGLFTQGGPLASQPRYAVPQGGPYVAAPNAYVPGRGER